jgi:co-chaperonin GroES (HSP10)
MSSDAVFQDRLFTDDITSIDGKLKNNHLLIEVEEYVYENLTLKSGLKLFIDNTEQVHNYIVRHGKVVRVPDKLTFWDTDKTGITWKTTMDVKVGDVVWFYGITSHSSEKITFEGKKYIFVRYDDLYIAKRDNDIICLNGNVLMKPLYKTVKALAYEKEEVDTVFAEIYKVGKINLSYQNETMMDDPDLRVGMKAFIFGMAVRYLEMKPYLFLDGNQYLVCQNNEIKAYI